MAFKSEIVKLKTLELLENVGDMSLKRRARKIIEELDLKDGDEVLDLGCGDGYYLYFLSNLPLKLKLIGFDHDPIVLANARKNLSSKKIKLIRGDIFKLPFKDNSVQKIIMTEVLEHVEDDKRALQEIFRVLKPKGVLVITVPSLDYPFLWDPINWVLQRMFDTHISGTGFWAGIWARHARLYQTKEMVSLMKKQKFNIEKIEEITSRAIPFNHHLINLVARFLYDLKPPSEMSDPISKFKNVKKPLLIRTAFFMINMFDKLNDYFPGKHGLNIFVVARKT